MPSLEKEAAAVEPWAAGIGLGVLIVVLGAALFTARERADRAALEEVITPTAVGDAHYAREPAGGSGPTGLKYRGQELDMVSESKIRDAKLLRVGVDDSGAWTLYRLEDEKQAPPKEHFFIKVAENEYMEVTAE